MANDSRNMASRSSEKMNKSPCSSCCWPSCHAAGKRPLLHGIFFSVFSNQHGVHNPPAVPSGAAQGHTTQLARGEIFKLPLPTGQSNSRNKKLKLKLRGGVEGMNVNVMGGCTRAKRTRPDPARPQSSILGAAESRRCSTRKVMRGCRGANALGATGCRRHSNRKVMPESAGRTRSARQSVIGVVTEK